MSLRYLAPVGILAGVTLLVSVAVQPVAAQTPPRTPWGDPNLQGVWTNTTLTPLERPENVRSEERRVGKECRL